MTNNLLIIDVQKGFINEHTEHLPNKIENLQEQYENIYVVQFVNLSNSLFRSQLHWDNFNLNSEETKSAFQLKPHVKTYQKYSYGIPHCVLDDMHNDDVSSVDVCGISTDACILKAAMDLFDEKIVPRILTEYCACYHGKEKHRQALKFLESLIGSENIIKSK